MSTFVAVAEAGGFAPAARRLALSPPSVTRAVAELEGHLGCRLLHRTMQHSFFENLTFPKASDPAVPPIRPQRHQPGSIVTLHFQIVLAVARRLVRCPCCMKPYNQRETTQQWNL